MSSESPLSTTPANERAQEVVIISHSAFFYWWPLWAVGFLMAAITYFSGHYVAFVPPGTEVRHDARIEGVDGPRDALVAPAGQQLPVPAHDGDKTKLPQLTMRPVTTRASSGP